jgi:hypothetical protein
VCRVAWTRRDCSLRDDYWPLVSEPSAFGGNAVSELARHCQAKGPDIGELATAGESHGMVSEASAQFVFFKITRGLTSMHQVLNVRLRLPGIDPRRSR